MDNLKLTKSQIKKISKRIYHNEDIATYYKRKAQDDNKDIYYNHAVNITLCQKFWDVDYFRFMAVKDVKRVNHCKDLYCQQCQHVLSMKRYFKYKPVLDDLGIDYDLYHITFTVPNVSSILLKATLIQMYEKFAYVNQYFQCKRKAKGFDFSQFGFVGAVRALEVTVRNTVEYFDYHPHFHCIFVMKKDIDLKKTEYNKFSFDRKTYKKKGFSKFEIFLQKFWFLLYNGQKFNKANFDSIIEGYSCVCQKIDKGDYKEVFKYALGGIFKKGFDLTYDIFNTLFNSLYRRKIIQGYGVLNKFTFDDDESAEDIAKNYFAVRAELEKIEKPVNDIVLFEQIAKDIDNNILFISKFRSLKEDKIDGI